LSTGLAFLGGIVILFATNSWHEKDADDLSKAIAKEIWVDLKKKRFLNSVGTSTPTPEDADSASQQRKNPILTLLGWRNVARNGSTGYVSDAANESGQSERAD